MKRKELLAALGDLLDRKKSKRLEHIDELKTLLAKLEKKRAELQKKIPLEKNRHRQQRLNKELEVVSAQLAKGWKNLRKLEKS